MKYFHYTVTDEEISESKGEIKDVPADFIEYKSTLSGESIYYKIMNGKITDAIGEGIHEPAAHRRVEEFLTAFTANPPGAW